MGDGGMDRYPAPQRTSVLAIMALVFSLLCFIPGAGAIAIIFGGASIMFISGSRGRLGGLGMAITGVLLGLVSTVFWLFAIIAAASFTGGFKTGFVAPTSNMMAALDQGDYTAARQNFDTSLDAAVTDKQLGEFVAAYKAEVGSFQSMPGSISEFVGAFFGEAGQLMQNYRGQNEMPMPATFDSRMAVILAGFPQGQAQIQSGGMLPKLNNLGVLVAPGKEVWLLDPRTFAPVDNTASGSGPAPLGQGDTAPPTQDPPTPDPEPADEPAEPDAPETTDAPGSSGGGE